VKKYSILFRVYELGLGLGLLALVGAPFHQKHTRYHNIDGIEGDRTAYFYAKKDALKYLKEKQKLPVFRSHSDTHNKIGSAVIREIQHLKDQEKVFLEIDKKNTADLIGHQGQIKNVVSDGVVSVSLGETTRFKNGDKLNLFRNREYVGQLQIEEVLSTNLIAKITGFVPGVQVDDIHLTVNENRFVSFIAVFDDDGISTWEWVAIGSVLGWWFFVILADQVFFIWLKPLARLLKRSPFSFVPKRIRAFFAYDPNGGIYSKIRMNRKLLIWDLNLVIVFAFANILITFFYHNVKSIVSLSSGGMEFLSSEDFFGIARLSLYSISITGCMLGYGYSLVGPLWNKHIRNVDFTILGWVTNAICYPLLGFILVKIVPSHVGAEPTITAGPWYYLIFNAELLLNFLYTASVLNMGKKFGVMVDKGLVQSGFFSFVRHPSYTLETIMFLCICFTGFVKPVYWFGAFLSIVLIYYFRSEREDHFMSISNSDYAKYKEDVPYKYIPGVY